MDVADAPESDPVLDRALLRRLVQQPEQYGSSPSELVSRIDEPRSVLALLEEVAVTVQRELLSAVSGGPYRADQLRASADLDRGLLERGVAVRCLHSSATAAEPDCSGVLRELADWGADVRIADAIAHRLIVADRSLAIVPIDPTSLARGALAVREPVMVSSLRSLFASQWRSARPIAEADIVAEVAIGPDERAVLALIADGVTDETAARRLGLSVRTYRRRVAELMARLDAQSRFQAGVRAVERGWI